MNSTFRKFAPFGLILTAYLAMLLLIDRTGEFPLIDDWAYAHGVSGLINEGVLKISDWVAMTQVAHLYGGFLWSILFGYSLEHLREFTLLFSITGSIIFYYLTGFFTRQVWLRTIGTLILISNPIWIYLSHTFMTDIPFTALFIALIALIVRWMQLKPNTAINYLVFGVILVMSVTIVLIRQTGLGIGFSFLLWTILMNPSDQKRFFVFGIILTVVQILTLVSYEIIMSDLGALSTRYHGAGSLSWIFSREWWVIRAGYYGLIQIQYLGFFLLPLFPFVLLALRKITIRKSDLIVPLALILAIGFSVGGDILMNPRYTHLMQYDTVGHIMTIDFTYEMLEFSRELYPLWIIIHLLGLLNIGGWVLLTITAYRTMRPDSHPIWWVLLILGGYSVFISIGQFVFDRYMLLHLPLLILAIIYLLDHYLPLRNRTSMTIAVILLVCSFLFGVVGTHDSFEWNRARFNALQELEDQGISPNQIDGGAEYNSWKKTAPLQPLRMFEKSWWYVDGDEYAIAFNAVPGYEKLYPIYFTRYYGAISDSMYVIRRVDSDPVDSVQAD